MEIVSSACFLGLPPAERWQQIYLALGGTSECFMGAPILGQMRLILDVLGSEECIYSPEDFWRAWAAFLGIECAEDSRDAQRQIYGYYYDQAGDDTLPDPSCLEGLGPDGQMLVLFEVILGKEAQEATLDLTESGFIYGTEFESLSGWTVGTGFSIDSSRPQYSVHPNDALLLGLAEGEDRTLREPLPVRLANGDLALYYDSADNAEEFWRTAISTSANNGVTWTRHGRLDVVGADPHDTLCTGFVFQQAGTYYLYTLTSDTQALGDVPAAPYGNSLFSSPSATGPWTLVSDDDPTIIGAPGAGSNILYCVLNDAVADEWVSYSSANGGGLPFTIGKASSVSPIGPWAVDDYAVFPAGVRDGEYENPRLWYSEALGKWVMSVNEIRTENALLSSRAFGVMYADTISGFESSLYHSTPLFAINGGNRINGFITPSSPILDLAFEAITELDGSMGSVYGGDPVATTDPHYGQRICSCQLEAHPQALGFNDATATARFSTFPLEIPEDFVAEYVVEFYGAPIGGNIQFIWDADNGADAGSNFYLLDVVDNNSIVTLYRNTNGSYSSLGAGVRGVVGYTSDNLNTSHTRVRIIRSSGLVDVWINGQEVISGAVAAPLGNPLIGWRGYNTRGRVHGLQVYQREVVTISGLQSGDVVSLHGSGKLPATVETSTGGTLELTHSHFPLRGVQVSRGGDPSYFSRVSIEPGDLIWGGDSYQFSIP